MLNIHAWPRLVSMIVHDDPMISVSLFCPPDVTFDSNTLFVVSIVGKGAEAIAEFTFSVAQAPKSVDEFNIQSHNKICKQKLKVLPKKRWYTNNLSLITTRN